MSTDRDATRIVRSWLQTDDNESADRVLDAVLDQLDTTPQRRPRWVAWRFSDMNTYAKVALATAAVVVAALLGYSYLVARNVGGPSLVPSEPTPTPVPTPSSTPVPTLEMGAGALNAGSYRITDVEPFSITITVPAGW